ncbi:MAG: ABC transporter permease [Bacteroidota bacterium]|nr:ABC transporter permease [Bacteroidota bacterium]
MNNKPVSPAAVVWMRLRKNKPAMAGLVVIILATLVSIFSYLIIPDNTPDANEMNLSLSTLKPGSSVTVVQMPVAVKQDRQNFWSQIFYGKNPLYKNIPIDTFWVENDSLVLREFTGDADLHSGITKYHLAKAFSGSDSFSVKGNLISLTNIHGETKELTVRDIRNKLLNERIVSKTFFLGTDRFGRDLFSRILAGTRVSMAVGLIAVVISLIIGIFLGALAGFFRGRTDDVIMWLINVVWSIPTLLLVIAITMALGKGFAQVFIAVGLTMWVEVARVVRGQIFSLREMEFVEAGRALGYTNTRIILKHVLPNILSPVIVIAASNFASAILLEAGLSFLGMGAQPPTPSWGMMIKENYGYIIVDAAYLAVYPGLAIMIMVLAFTWLGNGLRDAIDAKEGMGSRV